MDFAIVRGCHARRVLAGQPVPSEPQPTERLMVHAIGLRGVDGFAGSAIQIALLKELAAPTSPYTRGFSAQDLADGDVIIFAHACECWCSVCCLPCPASLHEHLTPAAVNPYGFSWWRLTNGVGSGVDLSRNFHVQYGSTVQSKERFKHAIEAHNPEYTEVFGQEVTSQCWGACSNKEDLHERRVKLSELYVVTLAWRLDACTTHTSLPCDTQWPVRG